MASTPREKLAEEHRPEAIRARLRRPGTRAPYLSDAILGGIDGCVTTFAIVAGAAGAGFPGMIALILGFANLASDGFSMAASNYQAAKSQREQVEASRQDEFRHIESIPEGEREEIRQIFRNKGFKGDLLEKIVETISADRQLWVETMLMEELALQVRGPDPFRAAAATFFAFVGVGVIPLLPLLINGLNMRFQFVLSGLLAVLVFYGIGTAKGMVLGQSAARAGLGTLITGSSAALLAFAVGHVLRIFVAG